MSNNVIDAYLAKAKADGHKVFTNVTLYRANDFFGSIGRIDCRFVVIQEGVKYAQYNNAVKVTFLEKRKRAALCFHLDYRPFLILVPTAEAINPPEWLTKQADGSSVSTYASHDPRWQRDFRERLEDSGATILADYEGWNAHDSHHDKHTNCSRLACTIGLDEWCSKKDHRCPGPGEQHTGCSSHTCIACTNLECPGCCPKREADREESDCKHIRVIARGNRLFTCRDCKAAV